MLICPGCQSPLGPLNNGPVVCACGSIYPTLLSGGIDFLQGQGFPDFHLDPGDAAQQEGLDREAAGIAWRMEALLLPLIRRYSRAAEKAEQALTVLDCGCGNGLSVDILRAHGICAFGVDAGRARHQQWVARSSGRNLHSADALHLPFASSTFDVVLSSGLVEHIGIHEEQSDRYHTHRLPDCHAQRRRFVGELVRILKQDGFILLDHPNGAFPADFWHGDSAGSIRWHSPNGDMLPRFEEISAYFRAADASLRLYSLSPSHRLQFQQVRNHWYGKAFAPVMKAWLHVMDVAALSFLARSFLNPYLVTLVSRQKNIERWVS
jgi:SAM-dependent methyltransferase